MAVTVYEVRNHSRKELYVGMETVPFTDLAKNHRSSRPKALAHWNYMSDRIVYAEIDHKLPDHDARVFFQSYSQMVYVPDWKTLKDTGS